MKHLLISRIAVQTLFTLAFLLPAHGAYLETFSTPAKGYNIGFSDDFAGVNWTLSPWATGAGERDASDYFNTTAAGKLECLDLDQGVYWESPLLSISDPGTVTLAVDLSWVQFDTDNTLNNLGTDWIKVEYSVNGGAYQLAPNVHAGNPLATVSYPFENPGQQYSSSATVNVAGITGSTLKIRVTVFTNVNAEIVTIDNVSVPQAGVFVIGPPSVTTPTSANVASTTATLGGNVTFDGGAALTARGVVYAKTSDDPTPSIGEANVTNLPHGSATTGVFTVGASGLTLGAQYSFAAYATNSFGTTYTTPVSTFTTSAAVGVTSLVRADATPTNAGTVNWTLTFGSAVTGVASSNFTLSGAAAAGLSVGAPSTGDAGVTWNIPVNTGATDGALTLTLANATGLSSVISTPLPFEDESYTIDKTPPTVLSVTRLTPSGQNTNLTTVTFRVTYSEPVNLTAPAVNRFQVVPVNGSDIVGTVTGVTGANGTDSRDVTVNLTSGTGEFRLRVVD